MYRDVSTKFKHEWIRNNIDINPKLPFRLKIVKTVVYVHKLNMRKNWLINPWIVHGFWGKWLRFDCPYLMNLNQWSKHDLVKVEILEKKVCKGLPGCCEYQGEWMSDSLISCTLNIIHLHTSQDKRRIPFVNSKLTNEPYSFMHSLSPLANEP